MNKYSSKHTDLQRSSEGRLHFRPIAFPHLELLATAVLSLENP